MGLGKFIGDQIDPIGFIKAIFAKIYNALFKKEIAQEETEHKAIVTEVKAEQVQTQQAVAVEQKQIDTAEAQKAAIVEQIKVEQSRQVEDEKKIVEVKADEAKAVDTIKRESDDDALRSDF
jgi:hypothetical protein